jgi:4-hydroxythreonine-4-phosphate dehydrogenase
MGACIAYAVQLIQEGIIAAMVTCPITKAALQQAGYPYPGHTEMLAALCGTDNFAMMMAGDRLRVTLVTIHESMQRVPRLLTEAKIVSLLELTGNSLKNDFNIRKPKIAVAGLNPHAGEGGLFGSEEENIIQPAIAQARQAGWEVYGPFPPDTVFHKAAQGEFDVVVCMYHDQGLIPFKLLHFADGVNVTIGLPIIRTSVDHGTAYDIAGKGLASYASLKAAYKMAADIFANRKNRAEAC